MTARRGRGSSSTQILSGTQRADLASRDPTQPETGQPDGGGV
jgi:hypothetical protein